MNVNDCKNRNVCFLHKEERKKSKSTNGGYYTRTYWEDLDDDSITYIFDVYEEHHLSKRFLSCIKEGTVIKNIGTFVHKNKKLYINGESHNYIIENGTN